MMKTLFILLTYLVLFTNSYSCNNKSSGSIAIKNTAKQLVDESSKFSINIKEPQSLDTIKCNILVIRQIEEKLKTLKSSEIRLFLSTFSKDCSHNIEYSEYSNKVLFKVLELYPAELIECISSNKEIDIDYILSEISIPLLDINGKRLLDIINKASGDARIKASLIIAIKKAMD